MKQGYYDSKSAVEQYIKMAEGYDGKELIQKLKHFLPTKSSVLELGTGPGTDWEILKADYDVIGSDFSKEFLDRLKEKFPEGHFLDLDASSLTTERKFDGIYSNKVLHHLTDEELRKSINRQSEILNEAGIVCHSFWKGEGSETFKGMFVNNHLEDEIIELFGGFFEILLTECYEEFEADDSILLLAKKKFSGYNPSIPSK